MPAGQNTATYSYDPASNLTTMTYPNGLQSTFAYDPLNRLNAMNAGTASYGYALGSTGNRLSVSSTLANILSGTFTYNANDWLSAETYDNNGNTLSSGGRTFAYDFQNRLKAMNGGAVTMLYDGDGSRISKTAGGVTTQYLVDDLNPTGLSQVLEEVVNGAVQRAYTYGINRISERQLMNGTWNPSFYGYDGGGHVRLLTDVTGTVTDTYEYDAFGNTINSTGSTPNNYLYRWEQLDPDLGLYYLRARWYNPITGRFLARDPGPGRIEDPATLQRYLYARHDPINRVDPTGRADVLEYEDLTKIATSTAVLAGVIAVRNQVVCILNATATLLERLAQDIDAPITSVDVSGQCRIRVQRGPRQCRCTIRDAPPDVMAQCPPRVYGTGDSIGKCQRNAKFTAPQVCRQ